MIKNDHFSEKKLKAIELLMQSYSPGKVAIELGISRVTVYRWLKDDLFQAELSKRKNDLLEAAARKLSGAADQAVEVLIQLLESKQPNVRRLSVGMILDYSIKFSELSDLESRIKVLEAAIDKK